MKIVLSIFGDSFNPEEFSELIGIEPTDLWNKGEELSRRESSIKRKESAWEYSTGFVQTLFFNEMSKIIMEKFGEHTLKIKNYAEEEGLEMKMDVVVEIVDNQAPSLNISKDLISFSNIIGAEIDFDIYILENE
nr:DUF4279 domain-containing protein [uncultured Allomuricauda sp.]